MILNDMFRIPKKRRSLAKIYELLSALKVQGPPTEII